MAFVSKMLGDLFVGSRFTLCSYIVYGAPWLARRTRTGTSRIFAIAFRHIHGIVHLVGLWTLKNGWAAVFPGPSVLLLVSYILYSILWAIPFQCHYVQKPIPPRSIVQRRAEARHRPSLISTRQLNSG